MIYFALYLPTTHIPPTTQQTHEYQQKVLTFMASSLREAGFFTRLINPQRFVDTRLGLVTGAVIFAFVLLFSLLLGDRLRRINEGIAGATLAEKAFQMTDKLDRGMFVQYREIQLLATLDTIANPAVPVQQQRALLEQLQVTYTDYAWIGLTDTQGRVVAATGGLLEGVDVAQRDWYIGARTGPFVGDVHEAVLLASLLPSDGDEPLRFVDVSVPVMDADGAFAGVLGAHLSWRWAEEVRSSVLSPLRERSSVEMFILSSTGVALLGLPEVELQSLAALTSVAAAATSANGYVVETWPDGRSYLVGYSRSTGYRDYPGLGWIVLVRQATADAFITAQELQATTLVLGLGVATITAFVVWRLSSSIVRPIIALSKAAESMRLGHPNAAIPLVAGSDEIASLTTSVHQLVATLSQRSARLARDADRFRTLHNIDHQILAATSPDAIAQNALNFMHSLAPLWVASLTVFDWPNRQAVIVAHSLQQRQPLPPGTRVSLDEFSQADLEAMRRGEALVVADVTTLTAVPPGIAVLMAKGMRAYATIPLIAEGNLIGSMNLASQHPHTFTPDFMEVAEEIAGQLAIALQQAHYRAEIAQHTAQLEQRVAERTAELRQIKERIEAVLNNTHDPVLLTDVNGVIQQVNPAFETMFGLPAAAVIGRALTQLLTGQDAQRLQEALTLAQQTNAPQRVEIVVPHEGNDPLVVELALVAMREDETLTGLVCSVRDVTARKRSEAEIHAALERARELNDLKARYTSMVSHELRAPLAVINSSADMMRQYWERMPAEKREQHLVRIKSQVHRLVEMLDDMLALSRAEAVSIKPNSAPIDVAALCEEIAADMQLTTDQHYLTLAIIGTPYTALLDAQLIRLAITNLLSNAIKYSPDGGSIRLELGFEAQHLIIRVEDSGIGIPEADHGRLFEAFHRAQNVGSISGTGLGLQVVKQAVDAHRGTIALASAEGAGTTFTIILPRL
jgi:PAS domain S-box-containing protein